MLKLKDLTINIPTSETATEMAEYSLDDSFFGLFEDNLLDHNNLTVCVHLTKRSHNIQLQIAIKGSLGLTCDRTLEAFDYPINIDRTIYFKLDNTYKELDVDLYTINSQASHIELTQHIYDFVNLAIPIKKLHPRFNTEAEGDHVL